MGAVPVPPKYANLSLLIFDLSLKLNEFVVKMWLKTNKQTKKQYKSQAFLKWSIPCLLTCKVEYPDLDEVLSIP